MDEQSKEELDATIWHYLYASMAIFFVIYLLIAVLMARRDEKRPTYTFYRYVYVVFLTCAMLSWIAGLYVVYLGVPTWLAFGITIGKVLPASCDASIEVEGEDGLPCSLKRFLEWSRRITSGESSFRLADLESGWVSAMLLFCFWILITGLAYWAGCKRAERERRWKLERLGVMVKEKGDMV